MYFRCVISMRPARASSISCSCSNPPGLGALTVKNKVEVDVVFAVTLHRHVCLFVKRLWWTSHCIRPCGLQKKWATTFCVHLCSCLHTWSGQERLLWKRTPVRCKVSVGRKMALKWAKEGRREADKVENAPQLLIRVQRETSLLKCRSRRDCWKSPIAFSNVHIFGIYKSKKIIYRKPLLKTINDLTNILKC